MDGCERLRRQTLKWMQVALREGFEGTTHHPAVTLMTLAGTLK